MASSMERAVDNDSGDCLECGDPEEDDSSVSGILGTVGTIDTRSKKKTFRGEPHRQHSVQKKEKAVCPLVVKERCARLSERCASALEVEMRCVRCRLSMETWHVCLGLFLLSVTQNYVTPLSFGS